MPNQRENSEPKDSKNTNAPGESSGDPGRTPGSAEGDRETVEQDLAEKSGGKNSPKENTSR